ncbi:MAG TPA: DoxX family protein [Burkholderiales bacterium]|nr:DoxX family protein [Burkholderiales bacterium]
MSPQLTNTAALIGRILLAVIFVVSGFGKIGGFSGTAAYMASKGLPIVPVLLVLTIVIELGGGLLLIVGYKTRWVALVFFLWLIPVTLVFHQFWGIDAAQVQMQQIQFMKNVAIMGGMLMVLAFGPGAYSVDKR